MLELLVWKMVCLFLFLCLLVCISPFLFMLLTLIVFMLWILEESADESEIVDESEIT